MEIEIAKLGRMSQTGSSLITLYQDKHTPVLDLLVRESVQNCLDAGNFINSHAEYRKYVEVSFLTGEFCPANLNDILKGSTNALNKRFPMSSSKYLAVKDKYTVGLTGPLNIDEVEDYKYGNLLKLVYDICKPQEGAGAGGSWGIGKTIYFRIGIGLVIYYSRIWDEDQQCFSSRFAASLVEDEKSKDAIIPRIGKKSNTGIAWWGKSIGTNDTIPVTNEEEIQSYLKIFNIEPFVDKETGTIVIVPYIDEDWLLTNNRSLDSESLDPESIFVPVWQHDLKSYLTLAIQRWYFPRLNNTQYKFGRYLKFYFNKTQVTRSDMLPLFLCWQALYNCAASGRIINGDEIADELDINIEKINVRKYLSDTCAGYVSFATVGNDLLGMCPPDNFYSPYNYTDTDESDGDSNRPLLAFCRQPGMVVNYKGNEAWLKSVPYSSGKDLYTLSIFVLKSDNLMFDGQSTLEEYVRKSELADHHTWEDYNLKDGNRPDIISKIKFHTANKLSRALTPVEEDTEEKTDSGWGKVITDLILPKEGFGTKSRKKKVFNPRLEYENHKTISIALSEEDTAYFGDNIEFTYYVKSRIRNQGFNLNIYIATDSKAIHPDSWEADGIKLPYEIKDIKILIETLDGETKRMSYKIDYSDTNVFDDLISLCFNKTSIGSIFGLAVAFTELHTFNMVITFNLKVHSKNVKPLVKAE